MTDNLEEKPHVTMSFLMTISLPFFEREKVVKEVLLSPELPAWTLKQLIEKTILSEVFLLLFGLPLFFISFIHFIELLKQLDRPSDLIFGLLFGMIFTFS